MLPPNEYVGDNFSYIPASQLQCECCQVSLPQDMHMRGVWGSRPMGKIINLYMPILLNFLLIISKKKKTAILINFK